MKKIQKNAAGIGANPIYLLCEIRHQREQLSIKVSSGSSSEGKNYGEKIILLPESPSLHSDLLYRCCDGALFTGMSVDTWYQTLQKPSFSPPDWVFAPVWTILYFSMAVSLWLVWRRRENSPIKSAIALFAVQLFANVFWSALFFGMRNPLWAMLDVFVLLAAIFATMVAFGRISKFAGWLLLPYFLWVCFAAFLNYSIWSLNA